MGLNGKNKGHNHGNYLGGIFGATKLGKSAADHFFERSINASMGGSKTSFAHGDLVRRKMPMVVPYISNGSNVLRDRLRDGYGEIVGGRSVSSRDINKDVQFDDGIERRRR